VRGAENNIRDNLEEQKRLTKDLIFNIFTGLIKVVVIHSELCSNVWTLWIPASAGMTSFP
jgi:hypothetical protein